MPVLTAGAGLHETLALLTSQLRPDANHKEDMVFLKDVFSERSLGYLMKIHEKLRQYERQSPIPVLHSASSLAEDVAEELQSGPMSTEEKELVHLLMSPHLKAVLSVHDTVAQKNFDPVLPPLPDDFEDELEEESVKIVRLVKNKEPLGATIRRDEASGAVIVARVMRGGAADRSGLVHIGDELREVNGVSVIHKRPDEISQLLSQSQGSITLKIIPAIKEEGRLKESKVYMRALFDYIPLEDKATPCQEAGLPFKRGDILQVVSQDDATWWQAKRVGDSNLRAGLIPSKQFQESLAIWQPVLLRHATASPRRLSSGLRRSFRLSRKDRQGSTGEGSDPGDPEFLTYEDVSRYQQRPNERPRLVVLIGSLGARINELKQRVICNHTHTLNASCVSIDTTRPKKPHEKDGVEYHFVTKQQFDADVLNNKFIEHGEYKENQYGTSIEAIRSVQAKNKMCIVDVQPEALKRLRTAEFKPYVIFVKPRVPEMYLVNESIVNVSLSIKIPVFYSLQQDEDLQEMRQSAIQIDQQYGHLVDRVLIKEDSASACAELRGILERLEQESFWVPISWVRT
uniref:Membrane protein, palmitoylated 3a (MAGUK p55 subfamily member 3) n=1 Tax=Anabas testudineus TaxID=64144 RepID=A0A7N6BZC0_ANATE